MEFVLMIDTEKNGCYLKLKSGDNYMMIEPQFLEQNAPYLTFVISDKDKLKFVSDAAIKSLEELN